MTETILIAIIVSFGCGFVFGIISSILLDYCEEE